MRIRRVISPAVPEPAAGLWSNCLVADGVAYVSGLTSRSADGRSIEGADAYKQARIIFGKMHALLEAAGGAMADVVKLTIFVIDIARREQVWRARREAFSGDFPACSLVQVAALASPEILVEIEAVAHLGAGARG